MTAFVSIILTVGSWIKALVLLVGAVCATMLDKLLNVKATELGIAGQQGHQPVVDGVTIQLPPGTTDVVVRGKSSFTPPVRNYYVFVKRQNEYWPQRQVSFDQKSRTWEAQVSFGGGGPRTIVLLRLSPELEVLYGYYRSRIDDLRVTTGELAESLPEEHRDKVAAIRIYKGIEIVSYLPGMNVLQSINVTIG